MELPNLMRQKTKALNMPAVKIKTRIENFCEMCRQHSIKWGFCFICGFEVK